MTAVGIAREIIRAGQLETRICKALGANLTYFFAMRPAYKLRDADEKHDILDYFPFVFLVSTDNLGPSYHVYPFDTGGALEGAFDEGASPAVYLEDYALEETQFLKGAKWSVGYTVVYRTNCSQWKPRKQTGGSS